MSALESPASAYGVVDSIVFALDGACLLQSPESAAEAERVAARVAELELERHSTNEALSDTAVAIREKDARIAELEAQRDRRRANLVALRNDALDMRGALSPNDGTPRRVPMPLGETLLPAVEWLIGRVAELEQQLAVAQSPRVRPAPRPMRFAGVPDAVLEAALRSFVATHLDYDMHKYLEEPEDGGPDRYPELTAELAKALAREAGAAGFEVEPWGGEPR